MSTSDPDRPADDTAAPTTEPADEAAVAEPDEVPSEPAAEPADAPAAVPAAEPTAKPAAEATETQPTPAAHDDEPASAAATEPPTEPTPASTAATATEPAVDTGRHAVVRPAPTPPSEPEPQTATFAAVPARVSARTPVEPTAPSTGPATVVVPPPPPAQPEPDTGTKPQPVVPPAEPTFTAPPPADDELFPDPNAPRSTSVLAHILGAIVGLLLGPAAAGTLLLGQARILEAQADGWTDTVDTMGIVLVGVGLLLLGWVALLGIWTPAVPITAGIVLSGLGGVALIAPGVARDITLRYVDSSGWHLTITQVLVAGTSGTLLTAGFLLLLAGIVAVTVRRRGIRLGEFRERHR